MSQSKRDCSLLTNPALPAPTRCASFLRGSGSQDRALLIGDTRQHQSVEAGRPFEQLQEAGMRTAKLDEIVRQQDPVVSGNSICMDLQGIADGACTAGDPVIVIMSVFS